MHNLAISYRDSKRFADEVMIKKDAWNSWSELLGPTHAKTLAAQKSLAIAHDHNGEHQRSFQIYTDVYEIQREQLGQEDPRTQSSLKDVVWSQTVRKPAFQPGSELKQQLELLRLAAKDRHSGALLNTLALAEFRFENFQLAIDAAQISVEKLPAEYGLPAPHPIDLAVLSMSYQELGKQKMSDQYRGQFEEAMRYPLYKEDPDSVQFEVEMSSRKGKGGRQND